MLQKSYFSYFCSFCGPVPEPRFGGSWVPRLRLITDHGSRITDSGPPAAGGAKDDLRAGVGPHVVGLLHQSSNPRFSWKCHRKSSMVPLQSVFGSEAESFVKSTKTRGPEPYGSPFGNPLPSLFDSQVSSLRLPNLGQRTPASRFPRVVP